MSSGHYCGSRHRSGAVCAAVVAPVREDLSGIDGRGSIACEEDGDICDLVGRDLLSTRDVSVPGRSHLLQGCPDLRHGAVHQRSCGVSNAHDIGADALLRVLDANAPGQRRCCALPGEVSVSLVAHAQCHCAAEGREVHDVALTLGLEGGQEGVDQVEVSMQVQTDVEMPLLLRHLGKAHGQRSVDTSIDHHVHLAVLVERGLQHLLAL
mmetsp:Transcript_37484/g.84514  ORF Transcript_37484/g.84514 Transcript_37484/m.84514 type:complete len:209 (+) Transcript_37484:69-695(+)